MYTPWTQDDYARTYLFAARAHKGQPWAGDANLNYMVHVNLVSIEIISALRAEPIHDGDLAVKCALLHDVIEDTEVNYDEIKTEFGSRVADGVLALSKNSNLTKNLKMEDSLSRILGQPCEVWMVKMADRITNLSEPPKSWSRQEISDYRDEAIEIYNKLKPASEFLTERLKGKIEYYGRFIY
jgi:(p)ppGpp synthase/HD superfamily hydrolase